MALSLPNGFVEYTRRLFGDELFERYLRGMEEPPSVSIRVNRRKALPEFELAEQVPWCADGYYLAERPAFTGDPLLHAGCYYVQEAASMFVAEIIRQLVKEPVDALDMCAAPGGKTTAVWAALPEGSTMTANEPIRQRANILLENTFKWAGGAIKVTNNYPKDYAKSRLQFDLIVCDVPCSGEGMFRKDEGAIREWSEQNVRKCAALQREIVEEAWQCLKPGGILIYSTCTFNTAENEENIIWIKENLGAEIVDIETKAEWNITPALMEIGGKAYRFIPGVTRGEGLFCCVLRKTADGSERTERCCKHTDSFLKHTDSTNSTDFLDFSSDKQAIRSNPFNSYDKRKKDGSERTERCFKHTDSFLKHTDSTNLTDFCDFSSDKQVIRLDPLNSYDKRKKTQNQHEKKKNNRKNESFHGLNILEPPFEYADSPRVDVDKETAIRYLHREALALPTDAPRGIVAIAYRNQLLGLAKNIGTRANNLYPQEWKIRSSHI